MPSSMQGLAVDCIDLELTSIKIYYNPFMSIDAEALQQLATKSICSQIEVNKINMLAATNSVFSLSANLTK